MIPIKRIGLLAGAASLTLTGGSFADTTSEATNDELQARVAELEARLVAVEATESESWLTEQRAVEIKGLVQDVLADADTRSSLMAQGMTAGYDDGAVIASADGNWMLRTNIHLQTRFMVNSLETAPAGSPKAMDSARLYDCCTQIVLEFQKKFSDHPLVWSLTFVAPEAPLPYEQTRREPISEAVRTEVWRRDGARCVQCTSKENLEFDHIIPVSRGGATSVRNLQLLCKQCNLKKGAKI